MEIMRCGIISTTKELLLLFLLWMTEDPDGKTVPECIGPIYIGDSGRQAALSG